MAGALADFLSAAFPNPDGSLAQGMAFLRSAGNSATRRTGEPAESTPRWGRLVRRLNFAAADIGLLVLAGMAEEHEGFAAVFRTLHPRGEPRPSVGLAAQLLAGGSRAEFLKRFMGFSVIQNGAVRLKGEVPFFERSLEVAEALWLVLHGCNEWPASVPSRVAAFPGHGLEDWLEGPVLKRAIQAVRKQLACTVLITGDGEDAAFHRGLAVVQAAGREPAGFPLPAPLDSESWRALKLHTLARGMVPVIRIVPPDGPGIPEMPSFDGYPDASVMCGRTGSVSARGSRPLIASLAEPLTPAARRSMWSHSLPRMAEDAPILATRYPIEPAAAMEVASDLECLEQLETRPGTLEDLAGVVRARAALALGGGVKLIRPTASWDHLVLPRDRAEQLQAAIGRLDLQARVIDDWGFLRGRPGVRGVRMMFCGPPGTGKTLSAEVLAAALKVDLLFVDISRVVSKWIGETEKNLAGVFDAAERARAVLFFDEADALFGRRTEVSDAHDRYANLETAYLLARLERFEGLAILATNLRQNIDPAFLRRLEFVVEFGEPDRQERARLWRCHIPDPDLLGADVNLDELATLYPVVGSFIRNAALAAAFLAAGDGGTIGRHHFIRAIRREYEKSGKAFPGLPVDMKSS